MANIGYARVSTAEQQHDLQIDALTAVGCERIFVETASGALAQRPELAGALNFLRPGDVLVVWRLDRLGRSLKHLIDLINELEQRGIGFRTLSENIDTTTSSGRLLFNVMASLAQFERDLTRERTKAGLRAARARGRKGGRKPKMDERKVLAAQHLLAKGSTPSEVAATLGVSRATVYRHLARAAGPAAESPHA